MFKDADNKSVMILLSAILGVCVSATYLSFFNSLVVFSLFPLLSLVFCALALYRRYTLHPLPEGMGGLVVLSTILGILGYIVFIRAEYVEMGSNTIYTLIFLGLLGWAVAKYKKMKRLDLDF